MTRVILLLFCSLSSMAQGRLDSIKSKNDIPTDIISAIKIMDKFFSDKEKLEFKKLTTDSVVSFFWINDPGDFRYNWNIAHPEKSPIAVFCNKLGVYNHYDIYKLIVISFHNSLNKRPVNIQETVTSIKNFRANEEQIYLQRIKEDTLISIDNWKRLPVPTMLEVKDKNYGCDSVSWHVYNTGNGVYANKGRGLIPIDSLEFLITTNESHKKVLIRDHRKIYNVGDGYLVGVNRGEFGGALYWVSSNKEKIKKISNHQIVQFATNNKTIYAAAGLSHLDYSGGSIVKVEKTNNKWTAREYLKLPSAPFGIETDSKGNFIVGTGTGLLLIQPNKSIKVLTEGFWRWGMYPNSLVLLNNVVYIGMRKGVYSYNLNTGEQEWLMPK